MDQVKVSLDPTRVPEQLRLGQRRYHPPVLSLQLGLWQPLDRDRPHPLSEVPGSQMSGFTGLRQGETHSCLGSCWAGMATGNSMNTGGN